MEEGFGAEPIGITTQMIRDAAAGGRLKEPVEQALPELVEQYNFLHWHLAFPEIFQVPEEGLPESEGTGWSGGFDVILGNPPWEKNKIEEKEFFANYSPSISLEKDKAKRVRLINDLKKDNPKLHLAFKEKKLQTKKISNFYLKSGLYPLTGRRDVNLYSLFTELSFNISAESSKIGLVIPSGITTDEAGKYFTGKLVEGDLLDKVLMFSDRSNVFKGVSKHFCLLTFGKMFTQNERKIVICSELLDENDVHNISNFSKINSDDIIVVNPNTKTLPILKDKAGAAILFNIYRKNKCLVYEGEKSHSPWAIHELRFPAMFDMTNDRIKHFKKYSDIQFSELSQSTSCVSYDGRRYLPLYEAKLFHHYDHRWASYSDMDGFPANSARDTSKIEKSNPQFFIRPQYWVDEKEIQKRQTDDLNWQIGLRQITNTGNIRTTIVTALPNVAFNNKVPLVQMPSLEPSIRLCWIAMASSFALDFLSRQKLGGLTFNQFYIKQLSFPLPSKFLDPCPWDMEKQLVSWFSNRVFRLIYTASDLSKLASDLNYSGLPFEWNLEERRQLICELNSAAFVVYGYSLDDVKIAMKSFKILNETDFSTHGYCRTQNTIISIYKEMVNGSYADSKIDNYIPHKEFTSIYL
ncbi:hypothetical protein OAV01_03155 [Opitutales bacterium]|nr:hypothetical protein [Opitutales bacterium]